MIGKLLEIRDLDVIIHGRKLVDSISFALAPGETVALIGESGSGKSMTASAIMGLLPPGITLAARSAIVFDGKLLDPADEAAMRPLRGRDISVVFQDPMSCLNPFMTAGAQIDEALRRLGHGDGTKRRVRILELLQLVEMSDPATIASRYPHELSGGQQQRVMTAMALAAEPKLLIADEPTSALDATVQAEILALLRRLQDRLGNAMLFITHDLAAASQLADQIVVMHKGRCVEQGPTAEVLRSPKDPYTRMLVSTRTMLAELPVAAPRSSAEPLLAISGLQYEYPAKRLFSKPFRAVDDISIAIAPGETLGILGESGSGKSTLAKLIIGLARPGGGDIALFGESLAARNFRLTPAMRKRCQIIFQNPYGALNPRLTIEKAMREPLELLGLSGPDDRAKLGSALADVNLTPDYLGRYPHQLSGGQRQRVCIARALLSEPSLLICDEIVSALDATVQMQVLRTLKALQQKRGFAMLFIGHDIEIVRWVSDRIAVMHRGKVVEQGEAGALVTHPIEAYTRKLVAAMPRPIAQ
ncbi:peptide/nickel transport system ATP-binding protein [Bosea sp. AK1]|uniref:dipeptide ABC transporter ATP-binding protein n=1 Tax=Bosea sp. AK1 TaxID=2587160 RepID=UPI001153AB5B|nr:ABC transporter ATP-binding protein [Bosea sp. AK1]TQI74360.1 peptide/nickel transport system ATP-binding protein [Bosea sp. AK1]